MATRIALLSTNHHPVTCGVGDHSMRTAVELRRRGYDAHVVALEPAGPHPEAPDVPVHAVGRGTFTRPAELAALLMALRPHQLWMQYTHHVLAGTRFGQPLAVPLVAALRAAGVPTLLVAHELYTGYGARPDILVAGFTTRAQLAALMPLVHATVVTTHARRALVERIAGRLPLPARVAMVPVAANALPVPRVRRGVDEGPRVGTFSTLAVGKRLDLVVRAFSRVVDVHPTATLTMLGDLSGGGARLQQVLDDALKGHPARDRIRITGRLELREIAERVAHLDVFVFPSDVGATTRSGTLPLALGTGLPVVSWTGPDTGPWFVHGENAWLASALTEDNIAGGVLAVLADEALAVHLGEGARRLHDEHLAWDRVVDGLLEAAGLPVRQDA